MLITTCGYDDRVFIRRGYEASIGYSNSERRPAPSGPPPAAGRSVSISCVYFTTKNTSTAERRETEKATETALLARVLWLGYITKVMHAPRCIEAADALTACRSPCVVGGTTCSAVNTSSVSWRTYSITRSLSGGVLIRARFPSSRSSESLRSLYGDSPPTSRYLSY